MDDKLSITINIADRRYPLRIQREEEEQVRLAVKGINERILQYKKHFGKDDQDSMAMAMLQTTIEKMRLEQNKDMDPVIEEVQKLDDKLEAYLAQEGDGAPQE